MIRNVSRMLSFLLVISMLIQTAYSETELFGIPTIDDFYEYVQDGTELDEFVDYTESTLLMQNSSARHSFDSYNYKRCFFSAISSLNGAIELELLWYRDEYLISLDNACLLTNATCSVLSESVIEVTWGLRVMQIDIQKSIVTEFGKTFHYTILRARNRVYISAFAFLTNLGAVCSVSDNVLSIIMPYMSVWGLLEFDLKTFDLNIEELNSAWEVQLGMEALLVTFVDGFSNYMGDAIKEMLSVDVSEFISVQDAMETRSILASDMIMQEYKVNGLEIPDVLELGSDFNNVIASCCEIYGKNVGSNIEFLSNCSNSIADILGNVTSEISDISLLVEISGGLLDALNVYPESGTLLDNGLGLEARKLSAYGWGNGKNAITEDWANAIDTQVLSLHNAQAAVNQEIIDQCLTNVGSRIASEGMKKCFFAAYCAIELSKTIKFVPYYGDLYNASAAHVRAMALNLLQMEIMRNLKGLRKLAISRGYDKNVMEATRSVYILYCLCTIAANNKYMEYVSGTNDKKVDKKAWINTLSGRNDILAVIAYGGLCSTAYPIYSATEYINNVWDALGCIVPDGEVAFSKAERLQQIRNTNAANSNRIHALDHQTVFYGAVSQEDHEIAQWPYGAGTGDVPLYSVNSQLEFTPLNEHPDGREGKYWTSPCALKANNQWFWVEKDSDSVNDTWIQNNRLMTELPNGAVKQLFEYNGEGMDILSVSYWNGKLIALFSNASNSNPYGQPTKMYVYQFDVIGDNSNATMLFTWDHYEYMFLDYGEQYGYRRDGLAAIAYNDAIFYMRQIKPKKEYYEHDEDYVYEEGESDFFFEVQDGLSPGGYEMYFELCRYDIATNHHEIITNTLSTTTHFVIYEDNIYFMSGSDLVQTNLTTQITSTLCTDLLWIADTINVWENGLYLRIAEPLFPGTNITQYWVSFDGTIIRATSYTEEPDYSNENLNDDVEYVITFDDLRNGEEQYDLEDGLLTQILNSNAANGIDIVYSDEGFVIQSCLSKKDNEEFTDYYDGFVPYYYEPPLYMLLEDGRIEPLNDHLYMKYLELFKMNETYLWFSQNQKYGYYWIDGNENWDCLSLYWETADGKESLFLTNVDIRDDISSVTYENGHVYVLFNDAENYKNEDGIIVQSMYKQRVIQVNIESETTRELFFNDYYDTFDDENPCSARGMMAIVSRGYVYYMRQEGYLTYEYSQYPEYMTPDGAMPDGYDMYFSIWRYNIMTDSHEKLTNQYATSTSYAIYGNYLYFMSGNDLMCIDTQNMKTRVLCKSLDMRYATQMNLWDGGIYLVLGYELYPGRKNTKYFISFDGEILRHQVYIEEPPDEYWENDVVDEDIEFVSTFEEYIAPQIRY